MLGKNSFFGNRLHFFEISSHDPQRMMREYYYFVDKKEEYDHGEVNLANNSCQNFPFFQERRHVSLNRYLILNATTQNLSRSSCELCSSIIHKIAHI